MSDQTDNAAIATKYPNMYELDLRAGMSDPDVLELLAARILRLERALQTSRREDA